MEETAPHLIMLVNAYPYGRREAYLETELPFLASEFRSLLICSLGIRKKPEPEIKEPEIEIKRNVPSNCQVCPVPFASKVVYVANIARVFLDCNFYKEIHHLFNHKRLSVRRIAKLCKFLSRAHYEARLILRHLNKEPEVLGSASGVMYSYRFDYQPYVALLLKKRLPGYRIVARAHRRDLYETSHTDGYIPLRKHILSSVDKVLLISEHGYEYLRNCHPEFAHKLSISYLGTSDHGLGPLCPRHRSFNIVSCSNVVPVKRVRLIAEALAALTDLKITWTHYGDGDEMDSVKEYCSANLPPNIDVLFKGSVCNSEVVSDYCSIPYHLFLNVSESEGVPVSIMEATSFGIPCVATNVGGSGEIVVEGFNGMLLDRNFHVSELSDAVIFFATMMNSQYMGYRDNARNYWKMKFQDTANYSEFASDLYHYATDACEAWMKRS